MVNLTDSNVDIVSLDDAFDESITTRSYDEKRITEMREAGLYVPMDKTKKQEHRALMGGITVADRNQAVFERLIPEAYKDCSFDVEHIKRNIRDAYSKSGKLYKVYKFKQYEDVCNSILTTLRLGKVPDRSYLIGAPNGFGKTSFVMECIMTLRKAGKIAAPFITLTELAQLRADDEHRLMNSFKKFSTDVKDGTTYYVENNESHEYIKKPQIVINGYSFNEYMNAQCLFVGFSGILSKEVESNMLYQILSIRGAKGLPTIAVISTSLEPYERDRYLKEYIWDEIKNYNNSQSYDRVIHISCYKRKEMNIPGDENGMYDSGIID